MRIAVDYVDLRPGVLKGLHHAELRIGVHAQGAPLEQHPDADPLLGEMDQFLACRTVRKEVDAYADLFLGRTEGPENGNALGFREREWSDDGFVDRKIGGEVRPPGPGEHPVLLRIRIPVRIPLQELAGTHGNGIACPTLYAFGGPVAYRIDKAAPRIADKELVAPVRQYEVPLLPLGRILDDVVRPSFGRLGAERNRAPWAQDILRQHYRPLAVGDGVACEVDLRFRRVPQREGF